MTTTTTFATLIVVDLASFLDTFSCYLQVLLLLLAFSATSYIFLAPR